MTEVLMGPPEARASDRVLDRPLSGLMGLDVEKAAYVLLVAVALGLRLAGLGFRAMAHDESLGALYAWYLYDGRGYTHNPMMHGPWLFHSNALVYFLLGVSDFTARLVPALLGTALVGFCYAFRPWLGRVGAFSAALMFTFSPSFLYYSRYIRNDVMVALWTALMVLGVFGYLRTHQDRYIYLGALGAALALATKEVAYIHGFLLVAFILVRAWYEVMRKPAQAVVGLAIRSLSRGPVAKAALLFGAVWVLLYTTFLTNLAGLYSGSVGAVAYWLAQQDVRRGGQPWYYYLMLLPLYEFLPLFLSLVGLPAALRAQLTEAVHRRLFSLFLVWWLAGALLIYSWAGEKMPWLLVHLAMPLIFLAGATMDHLAQRLRPGELDGQARSWGAAAGFIGLEIVLAVLLLRLATVRPFASLALWDLQASLQWLAALALALLAIYLLWRQRSRLSGLGAGLLTVLAATAVLSLLTFRATWAANFINQETAKEPLVYAHATPDVRLVVDELKQLSLALEGDLSLEIAYDDESTWPFEWYFKDFPERRYFGSEPPADLDAPVVIVGSGNEAKIRDRMESYTRRVYKRLWWPLEEYKGLSGQRLRRIVTDPQQRADLWNAIWWRRYGVSPGDWPLRSEFILYVRKDVAARLWDYQSRYPELAQELEQPHETRQASRALGVGLADPLRQPRALASGLEGQVYVADSGNHRIAVLDADGSLVRTFGRFGSSGPGELQEPWGVAIAPTGNVFVADTWNHRIQVFSPEGNFRLAFGGFAQTTAGASGFEGLFWGPRGLAFDAQGRLLVADTGNKRIQVFTPQGEFVTQFGGAGSDPGQFQEPVGVAVGPDGRIYVADTWNRRVQVFSRDYEPVGQFPVEGWDSASVVNKPYLAVDAESRVYVSDPENHRILVYSARGQRLLSFGGLGSDLASFNLPLGLSVDAEGRLWVADSENGRLLVFAPLEAPLKGRERP